MAQKIDKALLPMNVAAWNGQKIVNHQRFDMTGSNFQGSDLGGINLFFGDWSRSNFDGGSLRACRGTATRLQQISARATHFSGARLGGRFFEQVDPGHYLSYSADFNGADLSDAQFDRADLRNADFRGAKLTNASFFGSDLRYANFKGAIIEGADFANASLCGVYFDDTVSEALLLSARVRDDGSKVLEQEIRRLSTIDLRIGIEKINRLIASVAKIDFNSSPQSVLDGTIAKISNEIEATLRSVFGTPDMYLCDGVYQFDSTPKVWESDPWSFDRRGFLRSDADDVVKALSKIAGLMRKTFAARENVAASQRRVSERIFIVHGHDRQSRDAVATLLENIGLCPVVLHEQVNIGRTIITKFLDEARDVGFAIALLTPDDEGGIVEGPKRPRARQNVVFELGFFIGTLGPSRVIGMTKGNIERPSDLDGVVYLSMDEPTWPIALCRELEAVGYFIDLSKAVV